MEKLQYSISLISVRCEKICELCQPWRGGGQFSGVASRRRGQLGQLSVASSHELSLVLVKCPFTPSKMAQEINFRVLVTVLFLLCCVQQGNYCFTKHFAQF